VNTATQNISRAKGLNTIRVIVLTNFLLLAAVIWPLNSRDEAKVLAALRATGIGDLIIGALQLWVAGSTLFATGLFLRRTLRKSDSPTVEGTRKPWVSDGKLLLSWWMTLLAICFYAFMLGRSGF
jgi:hypothetical protein